MLGIAEGKPDGAKKGKYVTRVMLSSTMGNSVDVELSSVAPGTSRFFSAAAAPPLQHAAALAAFDAFCAAVDAPPPGSREARRLRLLPRWKPNSRYARRFPYGRRNVGKNAPGAEAVAAAPVFQEA